MLDSFLGAGAEQEVYKTRGDAKAVNWRLVMVIQVVLPGMAKQPEVFLAMVNGIMLHVVHQVAYKYTCKDWH